MTASKFSDMESLQDRWPFVDTWEHDKLCFCFIESEREKKKKRNYELILEQERTDFVDIVQLQP